MNYDRWDDFNARSTIDANFESGDCSEKFETLNMEEYIPKKYNGKKILLFCNIASLVLIAILLISIITVVNLEGCNYDNTKDLNQSNDSNSINFNHLADIEATKNITNSSDYFVNNDNEADNVKHTSYTLVLSDNKTLWSFDIEKKNLSIIHDLNGTIGAFEVYGENDIFWSKTNTSRIFHLSVDEYNKTNRNVQLLLEEPRVKPQKMTFDWIGDNLYIVDETSGCLIVMNVQTKKYSIIVCDLIHPHDIDLDPTEGYMFILQLSDSILRGNMDGSLLKEIVISNVISAITLDRNSQRIYWVNNLIGIEISDYNGQSFGRLASDVLNIIDLAIIDDQLFWLWLQNDSEPPIHHLLSCKIVNGTCSVHEMQKIDHVGEFKSLRVVNNGNSRQNQTSPCRIKNVNCQQLCLVTSGGKHSCTCNLGWQLNPDKKTCREVKDFMLYTYENYIRGRILDTSGSVSVDVIWPTPYQTHEYKKTFFDYDNQRDNLYFSNGGDIYVMKLRNKWRKATTIVKIKYIIQDLVYDWITNNLIFIERAAHFNATDSLKMLNVESNRIGEPNIIGNCTSISTDHSIKCMNALAIDSNRGYIFFASRDNKENVKIYRMFMNGTILDFFNTHNDLAFFDKFRFMTIDHDEEKLYWIYSIENHETRIKRSNFDGESARTLFNSVKWAETINVHRQWIYLSNRTSIWRVDKNSAKISIRMVPMINLHVNKWITDVRIIGDTCRRNL